MSDHPPSASCEAPIASPSQRRTERLEALRLVLPLAPALVPFGAIYAALAVEAGFESWQVLLASGTIFAGASQYAMLDLYGQTVPAWSVLLAMVAINARHILYSAALGRGLGQFTRLQKVLAFFLLVDPTYVIGESRQRSATGLTPTYYFSYALGVYSLWMLGNGVGILFGGLIDDPASYGLDYILPIYFMSLIMGFRYSHRFVTIALASMIGSISVWLTLGSPWHILLGGLAGLFTAAWVAQPPNHMAADSEQPRQPGA